MIRACSKLNNPAGMVELLGDCVKLMLGVVAPQDGLLGLLIREVENSFDLLQEIPDAACQKPPVSVCLVVLDWEYKNVHVMVVCI